jgi:hypothetical protein
MRRSSWSSRGWSGRASCDDSCGYFVSSNSSRPMSMRRISLVPAPIS